MARTANPFRYSFKEPYGSIMCVYKCTIGKRYFIWTAKSLTQSVNQISVELDRRLRMGITEDNIYYKFIKYIKTARAGLFEVEVVLQTESPIEMLKCAHKLLNKGKSDPYCLNNTFTPNVSAWIPEVDKADYVAWAKTYDKRTTKKSPVPKKKVVAKKKTATK